MTPDLQRRLDEGQPPFNGWTISTDSIAVPVLREKITDLGNILRHQEASPLFWFKDWSFHDGFLSDPKPYDWDAFDQMAASDAAVEEFSVWDTFCAFAFYPSDYAWFCRIEIPEPFDDPLTESGGRSGRIDVSGPLEWVRALGKSIFGTEFELTPSRTFFR
jgi:hypothetical protein